VEVQDVIAQARDALTVKRVFGEPYEKDGVTIIPAARVQGAAGAEAARIPRARARGQAAASPSPLAPSGRSSSATAS
jgi:uncharacterized spore protein YtfJ